MSKFRDKTELIVVVPNQISNLELDLKDTTKIEDGEIENV